jgi:Lhr-like helicase
LLTTAAKQNLLFLLCVKSLKQKDLQIYIISITVVFLPAEDRQTAENAMGEPNTPGVTAATLTLESGIDIGYLERVIQFESPLSVASFLQRLGRSGRRG